MEKNYFLSDSSTRRRKATAAECKLHITATRYYI